VCELAPRPHRLIVGRSRSYDDGSSSGTAAAARAASAAAFSFRPARRHRCRLGHFADLAGRPWGRSRRGPRSRRPAAQGSRTARGCLDPPLRHRVSQNCPQEPVILSPDDKPARLLNPSRVTRRHGIVPSSTPSFSTEGVSEYWIGLSSAAIDTRPRPPRSHRARTHLDQGGRCRPYRLTITPGPPSRKSTTTGTSSVKIA